MNQAALHRHGRHPLETGAAHGCKLHHAGVEPRESKGSCIMETLAPVGRTYADMGTVVAAAVETGTTLRVELDAGLVELSGADLAVTWEELAPGEAFDILEAVEPVPEAVRVAVDSGKIAATVRAGVSGRTRVELSGGAAVVVNDSTETFYGVFALLPGCTATFENGVGIRRHPVTGELWDVDLETRLATIVRRAYRAVHA